MRTDRNLEFDQFLDIETHQYTTINSRHFPRLENYVL